MITVCMCAALRMRPLNPSFELLFIFDCETMCARIQFDVLNYKFLIFRSVSLALFGSCCCCAFFVSFVSFVCFVFFHFSVFLYECLL